MAAHLPIAADWFQVTPVTETITLITEPHVGEFLRANIWLIRGRHHDVLIDTGLGISPLRPLIIALTGREPTVILTHAHLDHMGSAHEFSDVRAHRLEPVEQPPTGSLDGPTLAAELALADQLPQSLITAIPHESYVPADYRLRPARVTHHLVDGEVLEFGAGEWTILHLPGHSPGSVALFDEGTATLFTGDVIYDDALLDEIAGADITNYAASMRRLLDLPVRAVYPGHGKVFDGDRLRALATAYLSARGNTCGRGARPEGEAR